MPKGKVSRKGNLILKRKVQTVVEYIESFRQTGSRKRFSELYSEQTQESKQYLEQLKEITSVLQEAYDNYIEQYKRLMSIQSQMSSENDVFSQLTQVLSNEKNAASMLLNGSGGLPMSLTDQILIDYDEAYKTFYTAFVNAKSFLDNINGTIRDEINETHIGVYNTKTSGFKEFWLDKKSMDTLTSFESGLLKLNISQGKNGDYNVNLALKRSLSNTDLIEGLTKAMNASQWSKENTNSANTQAENILGFNILQKMKLVSQRQGEKGTSRLDRGRIYEVWEKIRGYGTDVIDDILAHGYKRDTVSWLAQGDYSYIDESGNVHQAQDKLISINNFYGMGRVSLGNIRSMFQAFTVLSNPQQVLDRWYDYQAERWDNLGNVGVVNEIARWGGDNISAIREKINSGIDNLFGLFTINGATIEETPSDFDDIFS